MNGRTLSAATLLFSCIIAASIAVLAKHRLQYTPSVPIPALWTPAALGPHMSRITTFGQTTTAADLFWLRFIQYVGDPESIRAGIPEGAPILQVITDLDPLYGYAYELGGVALAAHGHIDDSNALLTKGHAHLPNRWQLPFFLAYNYWYELNDLNEGVHWLTRASAIPHAPEFVRGLAARIYNTTGRTRVAIEMFEGMLRTATDEQMRADLQEKLNDLYTELDLQAIDQAIARYRESFGQAPTSIDDLVGTVLVAHPTTRQGEPYGYDPEKEIALPPSGVREHLKDTARKHPVAPRNDAPQDE